jgi:hypothetical protein
MLDWLKSLFAWRNVFDAGVYAYQENAVTGRRRALRINSGGYSPLALDWLNGGDKWD